MIGIFWGTSHHISNLQKSEPCVAPPGLVRDAPSLLLSLAGNPLQDPGPSCRESRQFEHG